MGAGMGNVVRLGARPAAPLSSPVAPLVARKGSAPAHRAAPVARTAAGPQPQSRQNGRSVAQQRRQDVIVALLAASLLSFLATLTFSGLFLYLHLAIDLALVAYVGAVLTLTRRNQARSSQVTYLPQRAPMSSMVPVAAQQRRTAAR